MPFNRPDLQTIINRMQADIVSRLTNAVALLPTSLLNILVRIFSGAIHTGYGYAAFIGKQILPDLAETTWLNRHAFSWGVSRIEAVASDGDIIFTGVNGTAIPIDTKMVRDDGVEFETTAGGTITGGVLTLDVVALVAGVDGDTASGIFLTLSSPITGADDVAAVDVGLTGGLDEETDEALRTRILERIKFTPAGGSANDYKAEAKLVAGVANAFIFPNQNNLITQHGYVTAVILGVSPKVPSAGLLTDVQTALDAIKPVTATIVTAAIDDVTITMTIKLDPNTPTMQATIESNFGDLLDLEGTPGGTILLSHIRDAISTAGANDYEITNIEVDAVPVLIDDIVLTDFEYPVLGTITWQAL